MTAGLLLASDTNVPLGEGVTKVTWKLAVWFGANEIPDGMMICETSEITVALPAE